MHCCFQFFILLSTVNGILNTANNTEGENLQIDLQSPGISISFRNITLYMGYANNPFGASTRLEVEKQNMSEAVSQPSNTRTDSSYYLDQSNTILQTENIKELRSKRGALSLYNMISCATDCEPLSYKGYGCYCGFLGSGDAVDGIDRCCEAHDWCYTSAKCPFFTEYFIPYFWNCYNRRPLCGISTWTSPDSCGYKLCECDRIFSLCLTQFPCPYRRAVCQSSPWRYFQNTFMNF